MGQKREGSLRSHLASPFYQGWTLMVRRNFLSRAPVVAHEYLLKKKRSSQWHPALGRKRQKDHEFEPLCHSETLWHNGSDQFFLPCFGRGYILYMSLALSRNLASLWTSGVLVVLWPQLSDGFRNYLGFCRYSSLVSSWWHSTHRWAAIWSFSLTCDHP